MLAQNAEDDRISRRLKMECLIRKVRTLNSNDISATQKEQFAFPTSSSPYPCLLEKITVSHMKYFRARGGRFMEDDTECIWAPTNSPSSVLFMISMPSKSRVVRFPH